MFHRTHTHTQTAPPKNDGNTRTGVAILMSNKTKFKLKKITRNNVHYAK